MGVRTARVDRPWGTGRAGFARGSGSRRDDDLRAAAVEQLIHDQLGVRAQANRRRRPVIRSQIDAFGGALASARTERDRALGTWPGWRPSTKAAQQKASGSGHSARMNAASAHRDRRTGPRAAHREPAHQPRCPARACGHRTPSGPRGTSTARQELDDDAKQPARRQSPTSTSRRCVDENSIG